MKSNGHLKELMCPKETSVFYPQLCSFQGLSHVRKKLFYFNLVRKHNMLLLFTSLIPTITVSSTFKIYTESDQHSTTSCLFQVPIISYLDYWKSSLPESSLPLYTTVRDSPKIQFRLYHFSIQNSPVHSYLVQNKNKQTKKPLHHLASY